MTVDETVGKRILDCRTTKDISQSKLAQMIGVSTAAIWQWETRGKVPRPGTLHKIATALEVSPDYLLRGKMSANRSAKADREAAAAIESEHSVALQVEKLKAAIVEATGVSTAHIDIKIKISS
jgi:transcriptional regulator with XRE-family HTH domain